MIKLSAFLLSSLLFSVSGAQNIGINRELSDVLNSESAIQDGIMSIYGTTAYVSGGYNYRDRDGSIVGTTVASCRSVRTDDINYFVGRRFMWVEGWGYVVDEAIEFGNCSSGD